MSKAETATQFFDRGCNCAQAILTAYAEDFDLEINKSLSLGAGFGAGLGRIQDVCGAVTGAIMVLGLKSNFTEEDGPEKINVVYGQVRSFVDAFTQKENSIKCRELLSGCDFSTEEGKKFFKENNLRDKCRSFIRLSCELLEK